MSGMDVSSRARFSLRRATRPAVVVMRRRRTKRPASDRGEAIVRSIGVGLAVASTAFAGYMITHGERQPQFAGLEHLSIFSRPTTAAAMRAQERIAASEQKSSVDFTPVGSIGESERVLTSAGFVLLRVSDGSAVIQTPSTIIRVYPGDILDGLGRIAAIERRADRWVVITPSGLIVGN